MGYEEGGQLTEAVRQRPYAVVLLDEVEKAHPDVFNLLLQVLDDGRLSDSQGRSVDFRHTVVVMTSNLASRAILSHARDGNSDALDAEVDKSLAAHFRPEFLNRIDELIRFRPLQPEDLEPIVRLQLRELQALLQEQGLELQVQEAVVAWLARESYDPEYGARPCGGCCGANWRTLWQRRCWRKSSALPAPYWWKWKRICQVFALLCRVAVCRLEDCGF